MAMSPVGMCLFDLEERAAVFHRHNLDELGQISVPVGDDLARSRRCGVAGVILDQLVQPFRVVAGHVLADVNQPVALKIAA